MDGEMLESFRRPPAETPRLTKLRLFFQYWLAIALFNVFPLPKRSGFRKAFEYAGEAMDSGYSILIFPEGEITKNGGLQKFQPGVGLLSDGLEATIIPVQITGLYEQKIRGRRYFAPAGSVTIAFGKPIAYVPEESPASIVAKLEMQFDSEARL
jgi:long-chain acyl-CoA synthetase